MGLDEKKLAIRYETVMEYNGVPVIDSRLATLLRLIRDKGSLLAASRSLGIPYSRAWNMIVRAERILRVELVKTYKGGRGGGGAKLTRIAERLLEIYDKAERKLWRSLGSPKAMKYMTVGEPDIIIAYSHDPLLEIILGKLEEEGYRVEGLCIGSGMALATLTLEEADVACIHLYDPESKEYNKPYIEKFWLTDKATIIGGYLRELVFALKPGLKINNINELLRKLLQGELKLVNRNRGSGTRVYLDYLLQYASKKYNLSVKNVRGYENEVYTHIEAARQVALGRADTALTLRYTTYLYGLESIHVVWETYQCIALNKSLEKQAVSKLREILNSEWLNNQLSKMPGYKLLK